MSSCDVAELKADWVKTLLAALQDSAEIVAYRDERWQPFPALYRGAVRAQALAQMDRSELAMWRLIEAVAKAGKVVTPELPKDWTGRVGANSRDEMEGD